mgnify:CR=1 FL=1
MKKSIGTRRGSAGAVRIGSGANSKNLTASDPTKPAEPVINATDIISIFLKLIYLY